MISDREYDSMAAREIIELHEFIEDWVTGHCEKDDAIFSARLGDRFVPDFHIVMPAGVGMAGDALWEPMRAAHGSNPLFRIQIRSIERRANLGDDACVWTYEEWQRNALNSSPPDNGRVSSAVFIDDPARPTGLRWAHIHETWLPAAVIADHTFDW